MYRVWWIGKMSRPDTQLQRPMSLICLFPGTLSRDALMHGIDVQ